MRVPGSFVCICFWDYNRVCVCVCVFMLFFSFYSLIVFVKSKSIAIAVKISINKSNTIEIWTWNSIECLFRYWCHAEINRPKPWKKNEQARKGEIERDRETLSLCIFKCIIIIIIQTEYTIRYDTINYYHRIRKRILPIISILRRIKTEILLCEHLRVCVLYYDFVYEIYPFE